MTIRRIAICTVLLVAALVAAVSHFDWSPRIILALASGQTESDWLGLRVVVPDGFVLERRGDRLNVLSGWRASNGLPAGVPLMAFLRKKATELETPYEKWNPCENSVNTCTMYRDSIQTVRLECFDEADDRSAPFVRNVSCRVPGTGLGVRYSCTPELCARLVAIRDSVIAQLGKRD